MRSKYFRTGRNDDVIGAWSISFKLELHLCVQTSADLRRTIVTSYTASIASLSSKRSKISHFPPWLIWHLIMMKLHQNWKGNIDNEFGFKRVRIFSGHVLVATIEEGASISQNNKRYAMSNISWQSTHRAFYSRTFIAISRAPTSSNCLKLWVTNVTRMHSNVQW